MPDCAWVRVRFLTVPATAFETRVSAPAAVRKTAARTRVPTALDPERVHARIRTLSLSHTQTELPVDRFPPPLGCIHDSLISHTGVEECAVALAVHRNTSNNGLILTSGAERPSSSRDTFGFGYGHTISLIVRYDTRVRASGLAHPSPCHEFT